MIIILLAFNGYTVLFIVLLCYGHVVVNFGILKHYLNFKYPLLHITLRLYNKNCTL